MYGRKIVPTSVAKHDTEANWNEVEDTFIPLAGEVIVYDVDDNNENVRLKVGDGSSPIGELPFAAGANIGGNGEEQDPSIGRVAMKRVRVVIETIDWTQENTGDPWTITIEDSDLISDMAVIEWEADTGYDFPHTVSYTTANGSVTLSTANQITSEVRGYLSFGAATAAAAGGSAGSAQEMQGATALLDGLGGTVPAPLSGAQTKFLRGDATWQDIHASAIVYGPQDTIPASAIAFSSADTIPASAISFGSTDTIPASAIAFSAADTIPASALSFASTDTIPSTAITDIAEAALPFVIEIGSVQTSLAHPDSSSWPSASTGYGIIEFQKNFAFPPVVLFTTAGNGVDKLWTFKTGLSSFATTASMCHVFACQVQGDGSVLPGKANVTYVAIGMKSDNS